jgi:hypothetical protein
MAKDMFFCEEGDPVDVKKHASMMKLESVQAMLLLAGWSHSTGGTGWLTAGG